uniref:PGG domain-containing protein n=1 Tax=Aegilops tauschii subsp. strangulata TaxID=200361 RepID=A0A453PXN5_AEGTS
MGASSSRLSASLVHTPLAAAGRPTPPPNWSAWSAPFWQWHTSYSMVVSIRQRQKFRVLVSVQQNDLMMMSGNGAHTHPLFAVKLFLSFSATQLNSVSFSLQCMNAVLRSFWRRLALLFYCSPLLPPPSPTQQGWTRQAAFGRTTAMGTSPATRSSSPQTLGGIRPSSTATPLRSWPLWWPSSWCNGYEAGDPVMQVNRRPRYLVFFYSNSISLMASIVVIMMLLPHWLPNEKDKDWGKWSLRVMNWTILLDLVTLLVAYAAGSSRGWKTSVYVGMLILAVLGYFAIHMTLSIWSDCHRAAKKKRECDSLPVHSVVCSS